MLFVDDPVVGSASLFSLDVVVVVVLFGDVSKLSVVLSSPFDKVINVKRQPVHFILHSFWHIPPLIVDRPTQLICISDIYLSIDKYKRHSRAICFYEYQVISKVELTKSCRGKDMESIPWVRCASGNILHSGC